MVRIMGTNAEPNVLHSQTATETRKPMRLDWLDSDVAHSDTTPDARKPNLLYSLTAVVVLLAIVLVVV